MDYTAQCDSVDKAMKMCDSEKAYGHVKILTRAQQSKDTVIEDRNDSLPTKNKEEIMKRRTEYCRDLYNFELNTDPNILNNMPSINRVRRMHQSFKMKERDSNTA